MPDERGRFVRSDIPIEDVILAAGRWRHSQDKDAPGPGDVLATQWPPKLAYARIEQLADLGLLEYGTTARFCWPTEAGYARLGGEQAMVCNERTPLGPSIWLQAVERGISLCGGRVLKAEHDHRGLVGLVKHDFIVGCQPDSILVLHPRNCLCEPNNELPK